MTSAAVDGELVRRVRVTLYLLAAAAILAGGVLAGHYYLSLPEMGFSFAQGGVVGELKPGGPADRAGLALGDRVRSINGVSPSAGKPYVRPGQSLIPLTVVRDGKDLDLEIVPGEPSAGDTLKRLGYLSTALAFWIMAALILAFKPYDSQAQLLVLLVLLAATGILVLLIADTGPGWAGLAMNAIVLALGPGLVTFHTVFPERQDLPGKRSLLVAMWGFSALLFLFSARARLSGHFEWHTAALSVIKAYFGLCVLLGIALLAWAYRRNGSEAGKQQVRIVALGMVLALLPLILFILLPQIVPNLPYVVIEPAFLALVFIPASYLYAIFRHNLMRIDGVVSQGVTGFLLFLTLFALYLAVSWLIWLLMPLLPDGLVGPKVKAALETMVLIAVLMVSLRPLRLQIEKLVHYLFYGSWYDYQSFISRMTEDLGETTKMDEVLTLLLRELTGTMRLKAVALLVADRHQGKALCLQVQRGFALPKEHRLGEDLASLLARATKPIEQRALEKRAAEGSSLRAELDTWSEAGAKTWVPLVQQGEIKGVLVLGAKQTDEFLTRTDHEILETLRRHAASALVRAGMVEELAGNLRENQALSRRLIKTREQERRRIADDIHDHAVQEIIAVRMNLEMAAKDGNLGAIASARKDLKDVIDNLRSVIGQIRPRALRSTDLVEMVRKQADVFRYKRKLPVFVHIHGNGAGIPEEVRLAVFWVFLEGVNNARKHAGASRIEVSLDILPDRVRLEVEDDGRGFDMPPWLDELLMDGHLGLMEMRERIALVGGEFTLTAKAGQGSRIVADVPLPLSKPEEET